MRRAWVWVSKQIGCYSWATTTMKKKKMEEKNKDEKHKLYFENRTKVTTTRYELSQQKQTEEPKEEGSYN